MEVHQLDIKVDPRIDIMVEQVVIRVDPRMDMGEIVWIFLLIRGWIL